MTPEDILAKAADIIATEGHTKNGRYHQAGEGYCALGAMGKAAGHLGANLEGDYDLLAGFWYDKNCITAAERVANAAGLDEYHGIPEWNDIEASAEDVILAMKKAAHESGR